eukprot:CAMPEP_0198149746 /NCGR_PEP_ID=MMETSP1443-20131203/47987_1 /TAXON_ID=186043 /ORGANISM="Entomoneis sp., Strain CCMP2396" /LENGTH=228 /DNA_ID=CAMNT_0043814863 /DNA_START=28 /DNA_END=714 /DNA_ORIENTATION=+
MKVMKGKRANSFCTAACAGDLSQSSTLSADGPCRKPLRRISVNGGQKKSVKFNEEANVQYGDNRKLINYARLWYASNDYRSFRANIFYTLDSVLAAGDRSGSDEHESPRQVVSKFYDFCHHQKLSTMDMLSKKDWVEMKHHYDNDTEHILGMEKFVDSRISVNNSELRECLWEIIQEFQNDKSNKYIREANIATVCEEASQGSKLFAHVIAMPLVPCVNKVANAQMGL